RNGVSGARVTPGAPLTATPEAGNSGDTGLTNNQIIFATSNGGTWKGGNGSTDNGDRVEQFGVSGSSEISGSAIDLGDGSQSSYSGLNYLISGIAVDTAIGRYYAFVDNPATSTITIQMGSLTGGGVTTAFTIPIPDAYDPNNNGTFAIPGALALDAQTGTLYFAQAAENVDTGDTFADDTGIYRATIEADGSLSGPTLLTPTSAGLVNPDYVVLDLADNLAFFTDSIEAGGGFPATDNLDEVNLTTGATTVMIENFFPTTDANDLMQGLALNGNTLYLTTVDYGDNNSTNNQILSIPLTVSGSGSTAKATAGTATLLYSGAGAGQPVSIAIDAAHAIFYTTGEQFISTGTDAGDYYGAVYEGSLSGGASLTEVLSMSTTVTGEAALNTDPVQLVLLTQPTLTAGGTASAISGDGAVTVDSGVTVSDSDGQNLASATVSIASGAGTGDTLSFTNENGITGSFSSGTLTLTGTANSADYQAALDSVTFSTTSTSATARTIDWTVSDGYVSSATATSTVDVLLPLTSTTTGLVSSLNPSTSGESVTFTATVASGTGTPSGTVHFENGTSGLGTIKLVDGKAMITTSALSAGSHTMNAYYSGSTQYAASSASLMQTVNKVATTTTITDASPSPSTYGQPVTFTATVTTTAGSPIGKVVFKRGTVTLGSGTLSGGTASYATTPTQLPAGDYAITAVYDGNAKQAGSTSAVYPQTVNPAATTTSLSTSGSPSASRSPVTFTATVSSSAGAPRGNVVFLDGTTLLHTASLSGGTAKFTTSRLTVGTHTINAQYEATGNYAGSTGQVTQTVQLRETRRGLVVGFILGKGNH
ncbi:MAG: Ig-like domain-containing protein, partial [Candidatus Sulfotelmatobacter sp.]